MYRYNDIRILHLEPTSRCNARCPMCARTEEDGQSNRHLPLTELSLADVRRIFPQDFIKQLWELYMCGNYGDPVAAKDTLEIFTYLKAINPSLMTKMHTNGSARSTEWWADLASVCDQVYFGIDGLADTNGLYRIGTQFEKIMNNAKAYIKAGGHAKWQYIVFEHNEHQIDEARKMAYTMGFKEFNLKKTGRFFSNSKMQAKDEMVVKDTRLEQEHTLRKPQNPKYQNAALNKESDLIHRYGSMVAYLNSTEIKCQAVETRSLYVSAEGLIFPCCWTANQMYVWYKEPESSEVWKWIRDLPEGKQSLSSLHHSLQSIIEGVFFQKMIPTSWGCPSIDSGKSWVCAKTCGQEFNQFKMQFTEAQS